MEKSKIWKKNDGRKTKGGEQTHYIPYSHPCQFLHGRYGSLEPIRGGTGNGHLGVDALRRHIHAPAYAQRLPRTLKHKRTKHKIQKHSIKKKTFHMPRNSSSTVAGGLPCSCHLRGVLAASRGVVSGCFICTVVPVSCSILWPQVWVNRLCWIKTTYLRHFSRCQFWASAYASQGPRSVNTRRPWPGGPPNPAKYSNIPRIFARPRWQNMTESIADRLFNFRQDRSRIWQK